MKWKTRWVDTFKNRAQNKIKTSLLSSLLDHASVSNVGCTSSKASACLFFGKASRLWSHHSLQGCRVTLQEHILISLIKTIQFTIKQRLTWKVGPRSCIILQRMLAISLGHIPGSLAAPLRCLPCSAQGIERQGPRKNLHCRGARSAKGVSWLQCVRLLHYSCECHVEWMIGTLSIKIFLITTFQCEVLAGHLDNEMEAMINSTLPPIQLKTMSNFRSVLLKFKRQAANWVFTRCCFFTFNFSRLSWNRVGWAAKWKGSRKEPRLSTVGFRFFKSWFLDNSTLQVFCDDVAELREVFGFIMCLVLVVRLHLEMPTLTLQPKR